MKRECQTADGRPKRRWSTRADAKSALRNYVERGWDVTGQQAYHCTVCDYFHIGHYPEGGVLRARRLARKSQAS